MCELEFRRGRVVYTERRMQHRWGLRMERVLRGKIVRFEQGGEGEGGKEGGVRNRKKGENKRGKDDAVERRARRELKRVGEK